MLKVNVTPAQKKILSQQMLDSYKVSFKKVSASKFSDKIGQITKEKEEAVKLNPIFEQPKTDNLFQRIIQIRQSMSAAHLKQGRVNRLLTFSRNFYNYSKNNLNTEKNTSQENTNEIAELIKQFFESNQEKQEQFLENLLLNADNLSELHNFFTDGNIAGASEE